MLTLLKQLVFLGLFYAGFGERVFGELSIEGRPSTRVQKRCARLILDACLSDNSVELFDKLGCFIPTCIDDVTRIKELCLMHKIVNGCCPHYFKDY